MSAQRQAFEAWWRDHCASMKWCSYKEAEIIWQAALAQQAPVSAEAPEGFVIAPHYRGYAHLGIGEYVINHSAETPAEIVVSIATEADKVGRSVGAERANPDGLAIQPEDMAVRIRFENAAGLDAFEGQLSHLRAVHFPESRAQVVPAEPVAWRYKGARGHWRYVGMPFTKGWTPSQVLHGHPLYLAAPAVSEPRGVHLDLCASQDDTMRNYPKCDCGAKPHEPTPPTEAADRAWRKWSLTPADDAFLTMPEHKRMETAFRAGFASTAPAFSEPAERAPLDDVAIQDIAIGISWPDFGDNDPLHDLVREVEHRHGIGPGAFVAAPSAPIEPTPPAAVPGDLEFLQGREKFWRESLAEVLAQTNVDWLVKWVTCMLANRDSADRYIAALSAAPAEPTPEQIQAAQALPEPSRSVVSAAWGPELSGSWCDPQQVADEIRRGG